MYYDRFEIQPRNRKLKFVQLLNPNHISCFCTGLKSWTSFKFRFLGEYLKKVCPTF